jgi:asparagine synthase (glutamine-hydrolysing)
MCGIAGIAVKPERSLPDLRDRLGRMARAMVHRGPDDEGIVVTADGRIGLVSRRLAIRDLSLAGHMPMANEDRTVWITYNGEIYNAGELRSELEKQSYRFRSHSDTEVVLRGYEAWGAEVTDRLRGMFAFAILDERVPVKDGGVDGSAVGRQLFLARDQMGVKPLYYAQCPDAFVFASELRALLASGLVSSEVNPSGLIGYLLMGSVPNPLTIYKDALALRPATRLTVLPERSEPATAETYWCLSAEEGQPVDPSEAAESISNLLEESVRVRLVSDVPLGAFLSGGLDSSSVVAFMRQATDGPIRTCSMTFDEPGYSEGRYARAVADAVGADHYERVITADEMARQLDAVVGALDQPSVDGVNSYFVSQTARQAGLTVALSGLGGDELFGGYPNTFGQVPQMLRALRLAQVVPGGPAAARTALGLVPGSRRWTRVRDALARPASPASAYLSRRGLFSPEEVRALVSPAIWGTGVAGFDPVRHVAERADGTAGASSFSSRPFEWISRAELRTYTHHQLLRDTDVMGMAHSLEVRVPLLDVELVEAVLRLPTEVKTNGLPGPKPLLRRAVGDRLPDVVRHRRDKQGFTFPLGPWLKGPLRTQARSVLGGVQSRGWLQPAAVQQVFEDFEVGKVHWSRLWALIALGTIE